MKKIKLTVFIFLSISLSTALSSDMTYVAISSGFVNPITMNVFTPGSSTTEKLKTYNGYTISMAAGYIFNSYQIEAEVYQTKNHMDEVRDNNYTIQLSGTIEVTAYFINGTWCLQKLNNWKPYAGLGIGKAIVYMNDVTNKEIDFTVVDEKDSALAYQAKAGILYQYSDKMLINANFRYLTIERLKYYGMLLGEDFNLQGPKQQLLEAGLQYKF